MQRCQHMLRTNALELLLAANYFCLEEVYILIFLKECTILRFTVNSKFVMPSVAKLLVNLWFTKHNGVNMIRHDDSFNGIAFDMSLYLSIFKGLLKSQYMFLFLYSFMSLYASTQSNQLMCTKTVLKEKETLKFRLKVIKFFGNFYIWTKSFQVIQQRIFQEYISM